ncbi:glycosyltransferase family 4 protein [Cyanobacterium stanieri LEGE 03274]|uniref:Glycosyltransferase family 4 protein n=1 Tax=Cyanobacterium stanieri LEGE 03274 TaxID=1828756 RepID=A0ABR9V7D3_9CHRO|nr:glycosyltransferase family 4 protein [Cyanobacterium stanieri]MBE9223805.1 glycosyltransferase family 4 protein [Cyanobacterium stanieri LEGE 03274]
MKHILFILPYLSLGGTEKQAFSLIEKLVNKYQISLLAPDGESNSVFAKLPIEKQKFTRWDYNFIKGFWELFTAIRKIDKQKKIDLIHIHGAHELMLPARLNLKKTPIIFTVHGYHGYNAKLSYQSSCFLSNLLADNVISVCQAEFNILTDLGLKNDKIKLIYNGVKQAQLNPDISLEYLHKFNLNKEKEIIIGTAARLDEVKGLTYLLQGFALVNQHLLLKNKQINHNLKLVIAGTGKLEESLKKEAQQLKIAHQTIFAGYISDLPNLMSLYDIFVLPSLQEAASLACVEAMSLAKPVIGTNVGGIPEQVYDNINGFIVEPRNPQQIADSLIKLIENPSLREKFAQNSYQRYQNHFASDIMVQKTMKLYEDTLHN